MGGVIRVEPVWVETFAGLRTRRFEGLVRVVRERLWIVDGTLVPVRDRSIAASGRNYRFSANVRVVVDADTRLVVAAARPVPGNRADAHAWRASDLPAPTLLQQPLGLSWAVVVV